MEKKCLREENNDNNELGSRSEMDSGGYYSSFALIALVFTAAFSTCLLASNCRPLHTTQKHSAKLHNLNLHFNTLILHWVVQFGATGFLFWVNVNILLEFNRTTHQLHRISFSLAYSFNCFLKYFKNQGNIDSSEWKPF